MNTVDFVPNGKKNDIDKDDQVDQYGGRLEVASTFDGFREIVGRNFSASFNRGNSFFEGFASGCEGG